MKNSKKKTMRFYLTLAGIKVLIKVLQLCGRNATHVPGRKAINICPDFLDQIDKPEFIIGITGTNGKTTVSNLIADVMQDNGYDIIDNRFGGNIDSGIASSLIKNSTMGGHMKKMHLPPQKEALNYVSKFPKERIAGMMTSHKYKKISASI